MLILVSYDIATSQNGGSKRLRQVSKICLNYGVRVQNSVFECVLDTLQYQKMKDDLIKVIDQKQDSLRFYNLGNNGRNKVLHIGAKVTVDMEDLLFI